MVFCSLTNKFPEANDDKNIICKKTLLQDGEIKSTDKVDEMRKKRRNASILPLSEIQQTKIKELLKLESEENVQRAIQLKNIQRLNESGEEYRISQGSICSINEAFCCRIIKILKISVSDENIFLAEIEKFGIETDENTG